MESLAQRSAASTGETSTPQQRRWAYTIVPTIPTVVVSLLWLICYPVILSWKFSVGVSNSWYWCINGSGSSDIAPSLIRFDRGGLNFDSSNKLNEENLIVTPMYVHVCIQLNHQSTKISDKYMYLTLCVYSETCHLCITVGSLTLFTIFFFFFFFFFLPKRPP